MEKLQLLNALKDQVKKIDKVFSHSKCDLINIQLKQGEAVAKHNASDIVVIVVRKGTVSFDVEGKEVILTDEDVLVLDPLEMHSLTAVTDVDIVVLKLK